MKIKRDGNGCYQPEKWAFLAEEAGNNAMFAATSLPSSHRAELDEQMKEEVRLNELIRENLARLEVNNGKD